MSSHLIATIPSFDMADGFERKAEALGFLGDGDEPRTPSRYEELKARTGVDPLKPRRRLNFSEATSATSTSTASNPGLRRRSNKRLLGHCVFCKNNNETAAVYNSHVFKDREGRVTCPVLYNYICPICKATGEDAHTVRYCPLSEENLEKRRQSNALSKQEMDVSASTSAASVEQSPSKQWSSSSSFSDEVGDLSVSSSAAGVGVGVGGIVSGAANDDSGIVADGRGRDARDDALWEDIKSEQMIIELKQLLLETSSGEGSSKSTIIRDFLDLPSVQELMGCGGMDDLKPIMEDETIFKFNVMLMYTQIMFNDKLKA